MRLIISTAPVDQASHLANELVTHRYAACVNLIPQIQSIYNWDGVLCNDQESLMLIKTSADCADQCVEYLKSIHPYEVPEIISVIIDKESSLPEYFQWVINSVKS